MPNIAQQDYIVFDAEGKDWDEIANAFLAFAKNIARANPINLLSILLINFKVEEGITQTTGFGFYSFTEADNEIELVSYTGEIVATFTLD